MFALSNSVGTWAVCIELWGKLKGVLGDRAN